MADFKFDKNADKKLAKLVQPALDKFAKDAEKILAGGDGKSEDALVRELESAAKKHKISPDTAGLRTMVREHRQG